MNVKQRETTSFPRQNEAERIIAELHAVGSEEKRRVLMTFFKTGSGDYAEGDRFMGVPVPEVRKVMKRHASADEKTLEALLMSPWHEARYGALVVMVNRFAACETTRPTTEPDGENGRKRIFDFYLKHTHRINNWDLVDVSAAAIVGTYLLDKPTTVLDALAESSWMWDNRIAIVATHAFIRRGRLDVTYRLADKMMHHKHDLMHKAIGWMLRETGKQDAERLFSYVESRRREMPRTMLRYAIERMSPDRRRQLMEK